MSRVLLHACCGPCMLMPAKALLEAGHEVTAYFANPNIHPLSEYFRRREAMAQCAEALHIPVIWQDDVYNLSGWLQAVHQRGIADNAEGARCRWCYETRLLLTASVAYERQFDTFTTSLLYSRHQRHNSIKESGHWAASTTGVAFLYADFRPFWQQGIDLSKELNVFRQNYCACIFSEEERFASKLIKLTPPTLADFIAKVSTPL